MGIISHYKNNKKEYLNYFLMYLVFAFGGIPFFSVPKFMKIAFLIIAGVIFIFRKKKFDFSIIKVIYFIVVIFIIQAFKFQGGTILNISLLCMIVLIPYLIIKIIGEDFPRYYVNITYFFAIIGLLFYTASVLSPAFYQFTSTIAPTYHTDPTGVVEESFLIYTYERMAGDYLRSPGPFWEPGAYAVFLVVALIFNLIQGTKAFNKKNVVLFTALITTFSTAGYAALFVLFLFYSMVLKINPVIKVFMIIIIAIISWNLYFKLEFLEKKISEQYKEETETNIRTETSGRFLGARKSLVSIQNHPLFGKGLAKSTQSTDLADEEAGGYGFLNLAARIGLIGFAFFLYFSYQFFRKMCIRYGSNRYFSGFALLALLLVLFGQGVYDRPIILMIMLTPMVFPKFQELLRNPAPKESGT